MLTMLNSYVPRDVDNPCIVYFSGGQLAVDVYLRIDGVRGWTQPGYDREATAKLLELFRAFMPVVLIYFNDTSLPFVIPLAHHDNHFHLKLRA